MIFFNLVKIIIIARMFVKFNTFVVICINISGQSLE